MPKNVANSSAARLGAATAPGVTSPLSAGIVFSVVAFGFTGLRIERLGIEDRRRDHVAAARPLAQVDQPAALRAERELRVRAQHQLATGGTTQAGNALARHATIVSRTALSLVPFV